MSERKYKYHTVNLPESLAKKIEEVIESGNHGYTSIPDFVKSAAYLTTTFLISLE